MKHYEAQIDAYIRGKLSPDEQSALELEVLENPDMLMEFELAVAMRKGAQQLDTSLVKEAKSSRWWQPWIGRPVVTGVSMAVAVVALVQLASLSSRGDLSRDAQTLSALSANVPILTFSRIRSARENTDFSVLVDQDAIQSELIVLELEIDWPPQPVYEVRIAAQKNAQAENDLSALPPSNQRQTDGMAAPDQAGQLASTVDFKPQTVMLNPDSRGYLVMAMPTSQLPAGDYVITIDPVASGKPGASYAAAGDKNQHANKSVTEISPNNNKEVAAQQVYTLRVKSAK